MESKGKDDIQAGIVSSVKMWQEEWGEGGQQMGGWGKRHHCELFEISRIFCNCMHAGDCGSPDHEFRVNNVFSSALSMRP